MHAATAGTDQGTTEVGVHLDATSRLWANVYPSSTSQASTIGLNWTRSSTSSVDLVVQDTSQSSATFEFDGVSDTIQLTASVNPTTGAITQLNVSANQTSVSTKLSLLFAAHTYLLNMGPTQAASFDWPGNDAVTYRATKSGPLFVSINGTSTAVGASGTDYVVLQSGSSPVIGLAMQDVRNVAVDATAGTFDIAGASQGTLPLTIRTQNANQQVQINATNMPTSLTGSWNVNPASRTIEAHTSQALSTLDFNIVPATSPNPAAFLWLAGVPAAASISANEVVSNHSFWFTSGGSSVSQVNWSFQQTAGGPGVLPQPGIKLASTSGSEELFVNVSGLSFLQSPSAAQPDSTASVRIDTSALNPQLDILLIEPTISAVASLTNLDQGSATIAWGTQTTLRSGSSVPQAHIEVNASTADLVNASYTRSGSSDTVAVAITVAPPERLTLDYDPGGYFDANAINGTGTSFNVTGTWQSAPILVNATSLTGELKADTSPDVSSGTITVNGSVGELDVALAPNIGGPGTGTARELVSTLANYLLMENTPSGGDLHLKLPNLTSASWNLPPLATIVPPSLCSSGQIAVTRSLLNVVPAGIIITHPDELFNIQFPHDTPTEFKLCATQSTSQWDSTLTTDVEAIIKYQAQTGQLVALHTMPTSETGLHVAPASIDPTTAFYAHFSGVTSELDIESDWAGGHVGATILSAQDALLDVTVTGTTSEPLQRGHATLGSGSIGHLDLLLVPAGTTSVNTLDAPADYLAVETSGKTPYMHANVTNVQAASWSIPTTSGGTVSAQLSRAAYVNGQQTLFSLASTGYHFSAEAYNSAKNIGVTARGASPDGASVSVPASIGVTNSGQMTDQLLATLLASGTGKLVNATFTGVPDGSQTSVVVSGAGIIDVTTTATPQHLHVNTTDGGKFISGDFDSPLNNLSVTLTPDACSSANQQSSLRIPMFTITASGQPSDATLAQGTFIAYGTPGAIPGNPSDPAGLGMGTSFWANVQCQTSLGMSLKVPILKSLDASLVPCGGEATLPIVGTPGGMPIVLATPAGTLNGTIRGYDTVATLGISLRCDNTNPSTGLDDPRHFQNAHFNYAVSQGTEQLNTIRNLVLHFQSFSKTVQDTSAAIVGACLEVQDACVQAITAVGEDLGQKADIYVMSFSGDAQTSGGPRSLAMNATVQGSGARTLTMQVLTARAGSAGANGANAQTTGGPTPTVSLGVNANAFSVHDLRIEVTDDQRGFDTDETNYVRAIYTPDISTLSAHASAGGSDSELLSGVNASFQATLQALTQN